MSGEKSSTRRIFSVRDSYSLRKWVFLRRGKMSKSKFHIAKSGKHEGEMVPCHAKKRCRNGSPSEHIILDSVEDARSFEELQLAKEYDGLNVEQDGGELQVRVSTPNGQVLELSTPAENFEKMGELYSFISEKIKEEKPDPEDSFKSLLRRAPASDDPYMQGRYVEMLKYQTNGFREDDKFFDSLAKVMIEKPVRA